MSHAPSTFSRPRYGHWPKLPRRSRVRSTSITSCRRRFRGSGFATFCPWCPRTGKVQRRGDDCQAQWDRYHHVRIAGGPDASFLQPDHRSRRKSLRLETALSGEGNCGVLGPQDDEWPRTDQLVAIYGRQRLRTIEDSSRARFECLGRRRAVSRWPTRQECPAWCGRRRREDERCCIA